MRSTHSTHNRTAKFLVLWIALAILLLPVSASADGDKLRHYAISELGEILKEEGYGGVKPSEDRIMFKADGRNYALFLYPDGDLQLYYGITGVEVSPDDLNVWNREHRLSRAYLDSEQDPILEADLLANAGINDAIISEFIKVFVTSSTLFRTFVIERDHAPAKPAAPASPAADI